MKLIDLDALGVGMANPAVFENRAHADGWNSLLTILLQAPVVDAEPVRHGLLIEDGPAELGGTDWYRCSSCGTKAVDSWMYYCPNCGAKMRCDDETE